MRGGTSGVSVVTGAFGYTGRYIAARLLSAGKPVKTLTGHPDRAATLPRAIEVAPLDFGDPDGLARSLEGADVLYNTYWIRFPRGRTSFDSAVGNTRVLIKAAERAGVRRLVHVSITNASPDSPLPYFRGKGLVEEAIETSDLSYAILRPTVIFGPEDILINNIAWFLRRSPVFAIFGTGDYRVQPIFVEDVAKIAFTAALHEATEVIDAVGPETFSYEQMVRLVADAVKSRSRIAHVSPVLGMWMSRAAGYLVRDVVVTRDEIDGLMAGLLVSDGPATGATRFSEWLEKNAESIGVRYTSELSRHYR